MSRNEYMAALRAALAVLPEEERAGALRYYEEYFDDAGPENEQRVIDELGDPARVAAQILADYRELTVVPPPQPQQGASGKGGRRSTSPWALLAIVLLALVFGAPLIVTRVGVLLAVVAIAAALLIVAAVLPLSLLLGGGALVVFSCFLWLHPANALVTLGTGLMCMAAGALLGLLFIKLCVLFVPPVFRGLVAALRWPFDKLRGRSVTQ